MNRIKLIRNLRTVIYRASKDLKNEFSFKTLQLFCESERELEIHEAYLSLERGSDV